MSRAATFGYPGLRLDANGDEIHALVIPSNDLTTHLAFRVHSADWASDTYLDAVIANLKQAMSAAATSGSEDLEREAAS